MCHVTDAVETRDGYGQTLWVVWHENITGEFTGTGENIWRVTALRRRNELWRECIESSVCISISIDASSLLLQWVKLSHGSTSGLLRDHIWRGGGSRYLKRGCNYSHALHTFPSLVVPAAPPFLPIVCHKSNFSIFGAPERQMVVRT